MKLFTPECIAASKKVEDTATWKPGCWAGSKPAAPAKQSMHAIYRQLQQTDPVKAGAFWRENEAAIKASSMTRDDLSKLSN